MHFDLVDMKLFVHVAESNSLTHGAEQSYMSLPAASMRIKNVEQKLGTKLLYRHSQGVTITPAGLAFLHYSLMTMESIERLMGEMQDYANGVKGLLRVFVDTNSIEFLPSVLSVFLATHPDVSIDLKERLGHDVVHAVCDGSTDVGIIAGDVPAEDLQVLPYRRDRLVLATAIHHALSAREAISFDDTLEYDYIGLVEGSAIQAFVSQAAKEIRRPLKIRIQVGNCEAMCRMIEANIGVGILPESVARRHEKNMSVRILALRDDWATRNLQICVRNIDLLPTFAKELIELLVADAAGDISDSHSLQGLAKQAV